MAKIIIISAPSGSGKSTIINYLLTQDLGLEFSISATSRVARGKEEHGKDYYFITLEEFRKKIDNNEFLEYEEVYENRFYGSLKSDVERILRKEKNVIFDVDVVGGCNIKKHYKDKALSIFIKPPSIEELRKRLKSRATDGNEDIEARIRKAEHELTYESNFDVTIINDDLETAKTQTLKVVQDFLNK